MQRLASPAQVFVLALGFVFALVALPGAAAQEDAAQEDAGAGEAAAPDGPSAAWPSPKTVADHEAEVLAYRAAREASLRQSESWLTLVGLHWLEEGTHTVGSGKDMDVPLPQSAPEYVGELTLATSQQAGGEVRRLVFTPADGAGVRVGGAAASGPVELESDAAGEPTQVAVGSVFFYAIDRRDETAIRVKDREAKARLEFEGLDYYEVDWDWRQEGWYVPYEDGKEIEVPSVLGGTDAAVIPGAVEFERDGETYRIDALPGGEGQLFLIFGDETNAETTYGGGRFLYVDAPPAANRPGPVVIDFNKAYSPPCVFSPWATCPLPPAQNRLDLAIEAGEKTYHGPTQVVH